MHKQRFLKNAKRWFLGLFKKEITIQIPKNMTLIKSKSDLDYVLMDAILIILAEKGQIGLSKLQYELLNCGLMVQQPLIKEAIKELEEHKCVSFVKGGLCLN